MTSPLGAARAVTKLPAQNLDRARRFYRDRLGLEPVEEREGGLRYVCGTTEFHIFASSGAASGRSTQLGFEVEDSTRPWPTCGPAASSSRPSTWATWR
jgi:catechol 2,3-dioxygenase-like lactoylglutathione lyase family enzyme